MPNYLNRVKSFPWAFNEVSAIDILNGYNFKFAKLNVHPQQRARAEQALREIAANRSAGADPRACVPSVAMASDPRVRTRI